MKRLLFVAALTSLLAAQPLAAEPAGEIGQIYTYRLLDKGAFEVGYRQHLQWHAERKDALVWYAWTVTSGQRAGLFIDGTFGATFAALDRRPDLPGDGANFAATAAPHATALGNETWRLWRSVSTATPLEDRKPTAVIDIFQISVQPAQAARFEAALAGLAAGRKPGTHGIAWYRIVRGGDMPAYAAIVGRSTWADIEKAGEQFPALLCAAYGTAPENAAAVMAEIAAIRTESWSYQPRLSLLPDQPLDP